MLGWLRRLMGGTGAAAAAPRPSRAAPSPEPPGDVAVDVELEAADPFLPFARALALEPPRPPAPLEEAEELAELELAGRLLDHHRAHQLGPASSPTLSLRILNLVASPDAEISELARIISADPALSAGVLTVANSVYHRGVDEIETVREAVTRLGLLEVGRVAGALSAKSLFSPRLRAELAAFGPRFEALYRRAVSVATAAAALAMRCPGARSDRAFLGGMLHDVGRTVALRAVADLALEKQLDPAAAGGRLERAVDRVHLEIGGEVHQEWKLPQYLTVLAVRHHDAEVPADEEFRDLHVVRLVAALHDLRSDPAAAHRAAQEVVQSAAALRLDPNAVRAVAGELRQAEERVVTAFGLGPGGPGAAPARR